MSRFKREISRFSVSSNSLIFIFLDLPENFGGTWQQCSGGSGKGGRGMWGKILRAGRGREGVGGSNVSGVDSCGIATAVC
jgi:hypothetical protein